MSNGFFPEATFQTKKTYSKASRCGECGLFKKCHHPKIQPQGNGARKILIVLPPVTYEEDVAGKFLRSSFGKMLRKILKDYGVNPLDDCYYTSALICHTTNPSMKEIDYCSFKLKSAIETLNPSLIMPFGEFATRSVVQFTWNNIPPRPELFFGYKIPSQLLNAWICPTYRPHPDYPERTLMFVKEHVEEALQFTERPYDEVPDYESQIEVLYDEDQIEAALTPWIKRPFVAGFDYETNTLKPDDPEVRRLISAAISFNGGKTYAFPWLGNVPALLKRLVANKKAYWIGSNIKYEQRWTKASQGFYIRRWLWDTMIAAHAIDNRGGKDDEDASRGRGGLTSVKFQAYLHLGTPIYDDHIKPYLRTEGSYAVNRIKEIPLKELLLYNGLDALLTWHVAKAQMKQIDHPALRRMK